jgi:hypothetical protein
MTDPNIIPVDPDTEAAILASIPTREQVLGDALRTLAKIAEGSLAAHRAYPLDVPRIRAVDAMLDSAIAASRRLLGEP